MDASEMAKLMMKWEDLRKQLDEVEGVIRAEVLNLGKTQTVGNVRVSYTSGRTTYDYETATLFAPEELVRQYTKLVTDHRAISQAMIELELLAEGDIPVLKKSAPSVSFKLMH